MLPAPLLQKLREVRLKIDCILNGEDNVKVTIYISELSEPVCLQMGKGENEVVIAIGTHDIECTWTNTK